MSDIARIYLMLDVLQQQIIALGNFVGVKLAPMKISEIKSPGDPMERPELLECDVISEEVNAT